MEKPLIIVVSGPSCTGKTTIAKKIAEKYTLPFINKDEIKEILFDSIGWGDLQQSTKMNQASYQLLFHFVESVLTAKQSLVVESNFKSDLHSFKFQELVKKYDARLLQIQCICNGEILFNRFKKRTENKERHPGHIDEQLTVELEARLRLGRFSPLVVEGELFEIDTTDFNKVDLKQIYDMIDKFLT